MGRENKKEAVAARHRQQILQAAEKLFTEKGFGQTTIGDISEASAYSRRTIYAYYESKVYILWSSISGLLTLTQTKGEFLTESLGMTEEQFLEYGFLQILHSIQEVKP